MKTKYLSVLLIAGLLLGMSAFTYKTKDDEGFKNLKVLPKNISEEELDSIMDNYCVSLGVKCSFCHAPDADTTIKHLDFASDKKAQKDVARKMMQMTEKINSGFFKSDHKDDAQAIPAVICYTCHRGYKEPDSKVFLSVIDSTMQAKRKRK